MKRLMIYLFLCAVARGGEQPKDMQNYLSETHRLARSGSYEEALERHLWFHEHALEHDPSVYGVRLSFALSYWKSLGEAYPPALEAMKKIRDEKTMAMLTEEGNRALFHDIASLNEKLDDEPATLALFRSLDETKPGMAMLCWSLARETVIGEKDFELARKYAIDLMESFNDRKTSRERMLELAKRPELKNGSIEASANRMFTKEILLLIELALATDQPDVAAKIQEAALKEVDDPRIRGALSAQKDSAGVGNG